MSVYNIPQDYIEKNYLHTKTSDKSTKAVKAYRAELYSRKKKPFTKQTASYINIRLRNRKKPELCWYYTLIVYYCEEFST